MLIAQAPGEQEDEQGRMFVGPSGRVLDELLQAAGLKRSALYLTNLVKCRLPRNRRPRLDEVQACGKHLEREIELVRPRALIPLGYYATRYVLGRAGIPAPSRREFHRACGRLIWTGTLKVLPLPHPALLLRRPELRPEVTAQYRILGTLAVDCRWYPVCPMRRAYEAGMLERRWVELYCWGNWRQCRRYQMEERGEPHPDWMLPDGSLEESLRR